MSMNNEKAARALKALVGDEGPRAGATLVDLGCCTGFFSTFFYEEGFEVTGIDARDCHIREAERENYETVEYRQADVMDVVREKRHWDYAFVSGILYHLENPYEFLQGLSRIANVVFLDTHYAPSHDSERCSFDLGPLTEHEGWRGRWFAEPTSEDRNLHPQSSWQNHRSFWLTQHDLISACMEAGFCEVTNVSSPLETPERRRISLLLSTTHRRI